MIVAADRERPSRNDLYFGLGITPADAAHVEPPLFRRQNIGHASSLSRVSNNSAQGSAQLHKRHSRTHRDRAKPEAAAVFGVKEPARQRSVTVACVNFRYIRSQQIGSGDDPLHFAAFHLAHQRVAVGMNGIEGSVQPFFDPVLGIKDDKASGVSRRLMCDGHIRCRVPAEGTTASGLNPEFAVLLPET